MGLINRCEAALRLFGDDLIPEEVCRLFGHFPSKAWMKGYQYTTSSGATVVRKTGAWILDADLFGIADMIEAIRAFIRLCGPKTGMRAICAALVTSSLKKNIAPLRASLVLQTRQQPR